MWKSFCLLYDLALAIVLCNEPVQRLIYSCCSLSVYTLVLPAACILRLFGRLLVHVLRNECESSICCDTRINTGCS